MNRGLRIVLILIAIICFGVAVSYPVRYFLEYNSQKTESENLSELRNRIRQEEGLANYTRTGETPVPQQGQTQEGQSETPSLPVIAIPPMEEGYPTAIPMTADQNMGQPESTPVYAENTPEPVDERYLEYLRRVQGITETTAQPAQGAPEDATGTVGTETGASEPGSEMTPTPVPTPTPTPAPTPSPTPDRRIRTDTLSFPELPKIYFDQSRMLPELLDIYELNHDLIGWLTIPDTYVDYPVVQTEDMEYYLTHDFYKKYNKNGTLILDRQCDPYTPSYNLIISGHHMLNGNMFGYLSRFNSKSYWEAHKVLEFDSLMQRRRYIIFAAFYGADYDVNQEGFRYNADVQFRKETEAWLAEIDKHKVYDTGIDVEFGDQFITLTTCNKNVANGRFVLVGRLIREGENY